MQQTALDNLLDESEIRDTFTALRRKGWKVKFVCNPDTRVLHGVRANFKHINIRAQSSDDPETKGTVTDVVSNRTWDASVLINGWIFRIWERNRNGGYVYKEYRTDINEAISQAQVLAIQDAPDIPTWQREDLPEPLSLDTAEARIYFTQSPVYSGATHGQRGTPPLILKIQSLILSIKCMGLVAIAPNCTISEEAVVVCGNKAWFLLECRGTLGAFKIVSDGDNYYPVKKKNSKTLKISIDPKMSNVDLAELTFNDAKAIRHAVKSFGNWYMDQTQ